MFIIYTILIGLDTPPAQPKSAPNSASAQVGPRPHPFVVRLRLRPSPLGTPLRALRPQSSRHDTLFHRRHIRIRHRDGKGYPDRADHPVLHGIFRVGTRHEYGWCAGGYLVAAAEVQRLWDMRWLLLGGPTLGPIIGGCHFSELPGMEVDSIRQYPSPHQYLKS